MRVVYAGADSIYVALEAAATEEGMELAQLLSIVEPRIPPDKQVTAVADMLKSQSIQSTLKTFCNDQYWNRIWIVQEFAIGHDVQFLFRDSTFSIDKFHLLLCMSQMLLSTELSDQPKRIYDIRESWQSNRPLGLLQMLENTADSQCKKRHDRVFGLLGLSPNALKYIPEPNYETDTNTFAVTIARSFIQKTSVEIILLAPHNHSSTRLPSWVPDFFGFDQSPVDSRIFHLIYNKGVRIDPNGTTFQKKARWYATGNSRVDITFQGDALRTAAVRVGAIRSLGSVLSDGASSLYPVHDLTYRRSVISSTICQEMNQAMLHDEFYYNSNLAPISDRIWPFEPYGFLGYSFVCAFLASHGTLDTEYLHTDLVRWICRNRSFFSGAHSMEDHAKMLKHPFFMFGISAFHTKYAAKGYLESIWGGMERLAKTDMRLMCLDSYLKFRIGWAAAGAQLHDQVFLIPGCSVPIVLRQTDDGRYRLVGDAIVIGAMENEVWGVTKAEDFQQIEIV